MTYEFILGQQSHLLGLDSKGSLGTVQDGICTTLFIIALFVILEAWKLSGLGAQIPSGWSEVVPFQSSPGVAAVTLAIFDWRADDFHLHIRLFVLEATSQKGRHLSWILFKPPSWVSSDCPSLCWFVLAPLPSASFLTASSLTASLPVL